MKSVKAASGIKFESALAELEKIVEEMETADLPLEKLIERYEQGMQLVKVCGDKLSDAEQKVEILTRQHSSKEEVKETSAEVKPNESAQKGLPSDSSEITLF